MDMQTEPNIIREASTSLERLAYRPNDAAEVLGVSRDRLFRLIKSGELASVKYGRTRLISRRAIERFLEANEAV